MPRCPKPRPSVTLIVDTREQRPFVFPEFRLRELAKCDVEVVRGTIDAGDYAVEVDGVRLPVRIERKSKTDLYGSVTGGRDRFEAEFKRARAAGLAMHLVVECHERELAFPPPHASNANPHAVQMTLLSWTLRLGVIPHYCGDEYGFDEGRQIVERDAHLVAAERTWHLLRLAVRNHLEHELVLPHTIDEAPHA